MTEAEAKKSSFPAKQKERGRLRQRGRRDTGLALGTLGTALRAGAGTGGGTGAGTGAGTDGPAALPRWKRGRWSLGDEPGSGQGTARDTARGTDKGSERVASTRCPREGELRAPRLAFEMEMSLPAFPPRSPVPPL